LQPTAAISLSSAAITDSKAVSATAITALVALAEAFYLHFLPTGDDNRSDGTTFK